MAKSPEEKRLANRLKSQKWRANNLEKAREKARRSMAKKRAEDPEAATAKLRAWQDANRDHVNAKALEYYYETKILRQADPVLDEQYKEVQRASNRRWYARHPAEAKAIAKAYKAQPGKKERANERRRENYADNPLPHRAQQATRYAQKKGSETNDFTGDQWEQVKEHYGQRCVYCPPSCWWCQHQKHTLTIDHITPLSEGGAHTLSNIVPACRSCNGKKGARGVLVPIQPLLLL